MVVGALGEQNRIVEPQQISSGASHSDLHIESGGDLLALLHSFFPSGLIVRRTRGESPSYITPPASPDTGPILRLQR